MAENLSFVKITNEITNNIPNLSCYKIIGRVDAETAQEFEVTMRVLQRQEKNVIFDFSELEYINSFGIGILVDFQKHLLKNDGVVKICGLSPALKKIFQITYLTRVFEIFDTLNEAIENFKSKNLSANK